MLSYEHLFVFFCIVQDLIQSKRTGDIDKALLLKLGKLGVNMSAVSRSRSSSSSDAEVPVGPHGEIVRE